MLSVRRVYVPADTSAVAVGADEVALAIAAVAAERRIAVEIVRTGSRGMAWLEPLVELETAQGRLGFGPIDVADVRSLFDTALQHAESGARLLHHKAIGPVEAYPWLARQTRLTFGRCGIVDPSALGDYCAHGGLRGLYRAVEIGPAALDQGPHRCFHGEHHARHRPKGAGP